MEMEIRPYQSMGDLHLGTHRNDIRARLFYKTIRGSEEYSKNSEEIADIVSCELKIVYNRSMICEFIEAYYLSKPMFMGYSLLEMNYVEARTFFESIDEKLYIDSEGFASSKYGITLAFEDGDDEPLALPYACGIFIKGYYDDVLPGFPAVG